MFNDKLHHKFVIYNEFMINWGLVKYHKELLPPSVTKEKVNGGGYYHIDVDKKIIYFYGKSIEYSKITVETFNKIKNGEIRLPLRYKDFIKVLSSKDILSTVIYDYENGT